ncbi:MAG: DUF4474 domain-containing protein [Clostridia bacterium]|nr:DUF4474 domain-containing protein [Clostridia bacterium]
MKNKATTIAVAGVAAAMVCIVAVLAIRLNNSNKMPVASEPSDFYAQETQPTYPVYQDEYFPSVPDYSMENPYFSSQISVTETLTQLQSQTAASTTAVQTEEATEESTVPESETATLTEKVTELATVITNAAFKEVFTLPKAPKYIPPQSSIDYEKVNLASYRYDGDGNFYYTDDKDCWQKNFGFNEVYDNFAPLTVMYYDTVRTTFIYDNKEWMIQMWKGQYGLPFIGGEVGVYTRPIGSDGTHYVCADKEDWLNMEMAFMWDEYSDGNYRAVFNRDYEKYWWCTGFVVGFPNGSLRKTLKEFRIVHHITFKDAEMANAFCEAFEKNGFTRVSKLDNNSPDTFVQVGADVGFVWQNINHK